MKKIIFILCLIMIGILSNTVKEDILIPNEAIRIRVIANSDSVYDQSIKKIVKNKIQKVTSELLKDANTVDEARKLLSENISTIEESVEEILDKNDYNKNYKVEYGLNLFPHKEYKGVEYEAGYYESLVVTLGSGEGDNWWCVLFPPLCLVEEDTSNVEEIEYQSYVKKLIDKYFGN